MCIGTSDFEGFDPPITVTKSVEVILETIQDFICLENDDRVVLMFTPNNPGLIPDLEAHGEFVRDTARVNIIDNDSKCAW